ncbi:Proteasome subunit beta type-6 [Micractinium conductrix]|uniref:Proteasome subunit beta n=1 Tax=Micractinium conductrix TaxID=554055 RepID=A0A2P6VRV6_9CHLO|nr:Proteasome subunit beta type-6 [Micractinium conductrix]|eukprot:PSC76812.1 Proteasome subunit beta type-6 [Micractinium conductrix]
MADGGPSGLDAPPHTGTTIVAVSYAGGVVIGADSRVSTGTYVSNRASDKITSLCDNVYLLRSGSAADTQAVSDYVRYFTESHEMQLNRTPGVWTVANLVKEMNYQYKHLVGAMIVAGWDEDEGGQVYGCPIGGTISREPWTTDGSGSTFLWGLLDSEFKDGMSRQEAEDLTATALALAMSRDGSSGGVIRLVTICKEGAERRLITPEQHPVFWDEIPAPMGMIV